MSTRDRASPAQACPRGLAIAGLRGASASPRHGRRRPAPGWQRAPSSEDLLVKALEILGGNHARIKARRPLLRRFLRKRWKLFAVDTVLSEAFAHFGNIEQHFQFRHEFLDRTEIRDRAQLQITLVRH